ncbi:DUF2057 domain-containing protein [Enterovibrio sp. Hal110]
MRKFFCLVVGMLVISAHAAEIKTSAGIEFLAANGKEIELPESHKSLELGAGRYQLVVRYENSLKNGQKEVLFTSSPYIVEVDIGESDLMLSIPKLRTEKHAESFFRNPEWILTNQDDASSLRVQSKKLVGNGFLPYSNIEKAIVEYNKKNSLVFDNGKILSLKDAISSESNNYDSQVDTVSQLKIWYNKATNEEKNHLGSG